MANSAQPNGRLRSRRPFVLDAALVALAVAALLCLACGCLSQAEREGVSRLPVNRPANWERPGGYVEGDL